MIINVESKSAVIILSNVSDFNPKWDVIDELCLTYGLKQVFDHAHAGHTHGIFHSVIA